MQLWMTAVMLAVSLSLPLVSLGLFLAAWYRDTLSARLAYIAVAPTVRNRMALLVVVGAGSYLAAGVVGVIADPGWISLDFAERLSGPLFLLGSAAFYVAVVIGLNPSRLTAVQRSVLAGANMYVAAPEQALGVAESSGFPDDRGADPPATR